MKDTVRNREQGMMTVEAVLSLVPFILLVMGIISCINIFMVHNKMQYALFQSASELSAYTYFYEAFGIRAADLELKEDMDQETVEIDTAIKDTTDFLNQLSALDNTMKDAQNSDFSNVYENVSGVITQGQNTIDSGMQATDAIITLVSDPQDLLRNVIYFGIEKGEAKLKTLLLGAVESALVPTYLSSSFAKENPMTADEYLKRFGVVDGVKGLDFSKSTLFTDEDYSMIDIVVEYDLEIGFFKLFMKEPVIHVVQRCAVPAWLGGDGNYYKE